MIPGAVHAACACSLSLMFFCLCFHPLFWMRSCLYPCPVTSLLSYFVHLSLIHLYVYFLLFRHFRLIVHVSIRGLDLVFQLFFLPKEKAICTHTRRATQHPANTFLTEKEMQCGSVPLGLVLFYVPSLTLDLFLDTFTFFSQFYLVKLIRLLNIC